MNKKSKMHNNFYYVDVQEGAPVVYVNEKYKKMEKPECGYIFYIEEQSKIPDFVKILEEVPSFEKWQALTEENIKLKKLLKAAYSWLPDFKDRRRKIHLEVLKQRINQALRKK